MEDGKPLTCMPTNLTGMTGNESAMEMIKEEEGQVEMLMKVTYHYLFPILITSALLTNLVNILLLLKAWKGGVGPALAATYRYLTWLAITDLLAATSLIPAIINLDRTLLTFHWAFYYAHLEVPIMNGLTSAGVFIVVGLSVDRYVAVCHPRRYLAVSAPRTAAFRVAMSLIVPALLYLPHCFLHHEVVCAASGLGYTYQGVTHLGKAWEVWTVLVELCHRFAPALLLVILNSAIICALMRLATQRRSLQGKALGQETSLTGQDGAKRGQDGARRQQERRLVHLLLAIVTCFLLTNLPAAVLAMVDTAGHTPESFGHEVFRAVANSLEVLGFSLNFFLYFTMMPGVREAAREWGRRWGLMIGRVNGAQGCSFSEASKGTECVEL